MAAIDFPSAPTVGQTFTPANGVTYSWNGTLWLAVGASTGGDFMASNSASIPVSGSLAALALNTVNVGNSGNWYNPATGRFTPPAGRYLLTFTGRYQVTAAGHVYAHIAKNGVQIGAAPGQYGASAGADISLSISVEADANGTDFFEARNSALVASNLTQGSFSAFPISGIKGPPGDFPSGLKLYDETTLVANNVEMRANIPASAKRIDVQFATSNTGTTDDNLLLNCLDAGGAVIVSSSYGMQNIYGSGAAAPGAQSSFPTTSWMMWGGINTMIGNGSFHRHRNGLWGTLSLMIATGSGTPVKGELGLYTNPLTVSGFRLANFGSTPFQAGSYLRTYVVV